MGGGVASLTLENPGVSGSAPVTLAVCTSVKVAGCGEGERSHPLLVLWPQPSWKEDTSFPNSPKRKLRPRKVTDCLSPKLTLLITSAKQTLEAAGDRGAEAAPSFPEPLNTELLSIKAWVARLIPVV